MISSVPQYYTNVTLDADKDFTFDITLQPPASTSAGSYNFKVSAKDEGSEIASQQVSITLFENASLTPATVTASLDSGQTLTEHKVLHLPAVKTTDKVDILLALDVSWTMAAAISEVKANAVAIMNQIRAVIPDTRFGVVSNSDYNLTLDLSSPNACGYFWQWYGGPDSYPYKRNCALTDVYNDVTTAINGLSISSAEGNGVHYDWEQSGTRVLYESYADSGIGWRPDAKRIILYWSSSEPHDCNVELDSARTATTGPDPGRDEIVGTADDLSLKDVLASMVQNKVTLVALHVPFDNLPDMQLKEWECYAKKTGGKAYGLRADGTSQNGTELATYVSELIREQVENFDTLKLEVSTPGFENWLISSAPQYYTNVTRDTDKDFTFDITLTPPAATSPGSYDFKVSANGDGSEIASQQVSITLRAKSLCTVSVLADKPTIAENGGVGNFVVARNDTNKTCAIYFTLSGTGTNGTDYTSVPDSVILQNGQRSANIAITAIKDNLIEGNETVVLSIDSSRAGHTLSYVRGTPASATIRILDNQTTATVTASTSAISENGGTGTFIISRSDSTGNCTVYYSLSGTARNGINYASIPDSVVLQHGQKSTDIPITAILDFATIGNQTVVLSIDSSRVGRTLHYVPGTPATATITILDYQTVVNVTASTPAISEKGGAGTFIVSRSDSIGVRVVYYTLLGTAIKGTDYTINVPDSVTLQNGQKTANVTISALLDYQTEGNETVVLSIDSTRSRGAVAFVLTAAIRATMAITDYTIQVSAFAKDTAISEIAGPGQFLLRRSDTLGGECTVYFTLSGTAANGADYTAIPDSLVLQSNQDSSYVVVYPVWDKVQEPTETVILTIDSSRTGHTLKYVPGTPGAATMKVYDYTRIVTVSASAATMSENKGTACFTITRSDTVGQCMVYLRLSGTASNGADYTADHSDSVLILNSQSMTVIVLNALADTLFETDETVVCAIDSVRDDHTIMYSVGTPGT
ncbi:MAG TPA: Calx-beta domain-containing protein, partial [Armatimonadota bacterium]|nr:Calx-beta domain-containing protein [Armatimonadota bacterium]